MHILECFVPVPLSALPTESNGSWKKKKKKKKNEKEKKKETKLKI